MASAPEGYIHTKKDGTKVIKRNGEWVPYGEAEEVPTGTTPIGRGEAENPNAAVDPMANRQEALQNWWDAPRIPGEDSPHLTEHGQRLVGQLNSILKAAEGFGAGFREKTSLWADNLTPESAPDWVNPRQENQSFRDIYGLIDKGAPATIGNIVPELSLARLAPSKTAGLIPRYLGNTGLAAGAGYLGSEENQVGGALTGAGVSTAVQAIMGSLSPIGRMINFGLSKFPKHRIDNTWLRQSWNTIKGQSERLGLKMPQNAGLNDYFRGLFKGGQELGVRGDRAAMRAGSIRESAASAIRNIPGFRSAYNKLGQHNLKTVTRHWARSLGLGDDVDELTKPMIGKAKEIWENMFDDVAAKVPRINLAATTADDEAVEYGVTQLADDLGNVFDAKNANRFREYLQKGYLTGKEFLEMMNSRTGLKGRIAGGVSRIRNESARRAKNYLDDMFANSDVPEDAAQQYLRAKEHYRFYKALTQPGMIEDGLVNPAKLANFLGRSKYTKDLWETGATEGLSSATQDALMTTEMLSHGALKHVLPIMGEGSSHLLWLAGALGAVPVAGGVAGYALGGEDEKLESALGGAGLATLALSSLFGVPRASLGARVMGPQAIGPLGTNYGANISRSLIEPYLRGQGPGEDILERLQQ